MEKELINQFIGFKFLYESLFADYTTFKQCHLGIDIIICHRAQNDIIVMVKSLDQPVGQNEVYPFLISF